MSCLGVHFALTQEEVDQLLAMEDEQERLEFLQEHIEEEYLSAEDGLSAESDKAWDAMHRALSDGELTWDGGSYPLNHVVLGGELLYTEPDYIMSLKSREQVKDIARALQSISEPEFRNRYFSINAESYGLELTEEDFSYTWDWFQNVRDLFIKASSENRFVLFTADQ